MNKPLIVALFATTLLSTGCDPKFWKMEMWMWAENHKSMDFYPAHTASITRVSAVYGIASAV